MIVLSQQQLTTLPDCNDDEVKDAADDVIKMLWSNVVRWLLAWCEQGD